MSEANSQRPKWGTRHKDMLDQVFPLWRGPGALALRQLEGVENFYGWSVLNLAVRFDYPMRLESRIVYAHLFDTEQPVAIVRSVAWDDEAVRKVIRSEGQNAPLSVPARFVHLPLSQAQEWLALFKDVPTSAEQAIIEDTTLPIRRVRVEWEYVSCVFEKVWKQQGPQHAPLLAAWTRAWNEMGEALKTQPQLDPQQIEELFDAAPPEGLYDTKQYDPNWLTLP